jgi:hypothetical protein
VLFKFYSDKEILDRHSKEIKELQNRAPVAMEMPEIKGDGLDMA